jgi:broad specificity phosphatase PhoE
MEKRMVRFFVIRHGLTADNVQMRYLGSRDEPLTDTGRIQADRTASALRSFPIRAVYTSPLMRAADTAARIGEACRADLYVDSRLAEGSFGRWEGLRRDEVIQRGSPDVDLLARWETDASCSPPEGESLVRVQARVLGLVRELEGKWSGSSIALVSHVGPIKALLAAALDMRLESTRRLFLDPCSISVIDWGKRPFVRLFNSHAHLGWESPRWAVLPGI